MTQIQTIKYKEGYKYQLAELHLSFVDIRPEEDIGVDGYVWLSANGVLSLKKGYAWDGPSGPTIDTLNFMRGSLVHDALYQLMRSGQLDYKKHRKHADKLLYKMCREDGMSWIRAQIVYAAVRWAGRGAAKPANAKKIITAPEVRIG